PARVVAAARGGRHARWPDGYGAGRGRGEGARVTRRADPSCFRTLRQDWRRAVLAAGALLVLVACGDGQVPPPPPENSAELAPNTIVLDDELTALTGATVDGAYTFSSRVGDLAAVQAG